MAFTLFRPSNSQQESAAFESLHVMRKHAIQRQKMPFGQIEDLVIHVHLDVAGKSLNGNSACRLVFMNKSIGLQHGQHNPGILLLDERLGVSSALPSIFFSQPFYLRGQIEAERCTTEWAR